MSYYEDEWYETTQNVAVTKVTSAPELIRKYSNGLSVAFLAGGEDIRKELVLSTTDTVKDIADLATDWPRESEKRFKAFVAAADKEMFEKYFPALKKHHPRFKQGSRTIIAAVLKRFPCVAGSYMFTPDVSNDLGRVIDFMVQMGSNVRGTDSHQVPLLVGIIGILVDHWMGGDKIDFGCGTNS